jgi:hypothetical protein
MERCVTGKKMYPTQEIAEEALIGAHTRFQYPSGGGPVAVYQCADCGRYHLTSRGPMNGKLADQMASGKIKLQKEADAWESRFRKR